MAWGITRNPTIEQPTYDLFCDSDADIASLPKMPDVQDGDKKTPAKSAIYPTAVAASLLGGEE